MIDPRTCVEKLASRRELFPFSKHPKWCCACCGYYYDCGRPAICRDCNHNTEGESP